MNACANATGMADACGSPVDSEESSSEEAEQTDDAATTTS